MTVRQLVAALVKCDQDLEVTFKEVTFKSMSVESADAEFVIGTDAMVASKLLQASYDHG